MNLQAQDGQRLHAAFARNFDRTKAEQAFRALCGGSSGSIPNGLEPLGEGAHFRVFRLKPRRPGEMAQSISVAKPRFLQQGPGMLRTWIAAIARLQTEPLPLVPPLELIVPGDLVEGIGVVMPAGEGDLALAAAHWQPIRAQLVALTAALKSRGLMVDDVLQGRTWQGVPFVVDWSDLKPLGQAY